MTHVQRFLLGALVGFLALLLLILLFAPGPGAPEGERLFGWPPLWIARIDHVQTDAGEHHWTRTVNTRVASGIVIGAGALATFFWRRRGQAGT